MMCMCVCMFCCGGYTFNVKYSLSMIIACGMDKQSCAEMESRVDCKWVLWNSQQLHVARRVKVLVTDHMYGITLVRAWE